MNLTAFEELIRDALAHLNHPGHLARLPLAAELSNGERDLTGEEVRQALLDTIDGLCPADTGVAGDVIWRQYRHLILRYREGLGRDEVATELGVSNRQASRDHERAVDAVASLLWPRSRTVRAIGTSLKSSTDAKVTDEALALATREPTAAQLDRVLTGVLATLSPFANARGASFAPSIPDTLPPVDMGWTLLRQSLLLALMYACNRAPAHRIRITAADTPRGIVVRISSSDYLPGQADTRPEDRRLLDTLGELLAAEGGLVELPMGRGLTILSLMLPPVSLSTVLVVDDNPDLAVLFRRFLRGRPLRVIQATSADEVPELASNLRPSAIILDVMLPSRDGWEVLEQLRGDSQTSGIPVIVTSVLPESALASSLGVTEFLPKPVTQGALLQMLERCGLLAEPRPARPSASALPHQPRVRPRE